MVTATMRLTAGIIFFTTSGTKNAYAGQKMSLLYFLGRIKLHSLLKIQKRVLPDLIQVMQKRYHILKFIGMMEPVGRRSLSQNLGMTERVLRSEVQFLKEQDLISISSTGMSLTQDGKEILDELDSLMGKITGLHELAQQIKERFSIKHVVVVSGNSDESPWVKSELGRATVQSMKRCLKDKNIIAVTGGTTMASIADSLSPEFTTNEVIFVPARGGIGEDVENQANTICAKMAAKTNAKHKVLYLPDEVTKDLYDSFIKDPNIKEVLTLIQSANIVLHGIGDALTMAERRKTRKEALEKIIERKAVGEAFGYYFNENGEVVHKVQTVGLQLEDLQNVEHIFAVAGGASKGKAISSYLKQAPKGTILITDESAALQLLKGEPFKI